MYARVKAHPGTRHLYAQQLIREGVITDDDLTAMTDTVVEKYEGILARAKKIAAEKTRESNLCRRRRSTKTVPQFSRPVCPAAVLKQVAEKISLVPDEFHINPKMVGQLARRAKMGEGEVPMDWGFAEAMASARSCSKALRSASAVRTPAAARSRSGTRRCTTR